MAVEAVELVKGETTEAIDYSELEKLVTVKDVAEMFEIPDRIVRREVRKEPCPIPGAHKILGKWGFDPDLIGDWTPPDVGEGAAVTRREDGRRRYRIFLSESEHAILVGDYEIIDPRVAAKARRAAKKAKAAGEPPAEGAAEAATEKDPFEDFEA